MTLGADAVALAGGASCATWSSFVSWMEPGLVLQVRKLLALLVVCGATRQVSAQSSQAWLYCHGSGSSFTNGFWGKKTTMGKVLLGRSTGLLTGISLVTHTVLGKYLLALSTKIEFTCCLVCQNWPYQFAGLNSLGRLVPQTTNVLKAVSVLCRWSCSYGEMCLALVFHTYVESFGLLGER